VTPNVVKNIKATYEAALSDNYNTEAALQKINSKSEDIKKLVLFSTGLPDNIQHSTMVATLLMPLKANRGDACDWGY